MEHRKFKYIIMATYAKILKDTEGNQILPYTRASLVYMDDGSTAQDIITRPATNAQSGRVIIGNNLGYDKYGTISLSKFGVVNALGYTPVSPNDYATNNVHGIVKVGSHINVDTEGVISLNDTNIKEALGYTPISAEPKYYDWSTSSGNINSFIDSNKFSFSNVSSYYTSLSMSVTMYSNQIAFCTLYGTLKNDAASYTNIYNHGLILTFSPRGSGSNRKAFPIYYKNGEFYKPCGCIINQANDGGYFNTMTISFTQTLTAGTGFFSIFTLYPIQ